MKELTPKEAADKLARSLKDKDVTPIAPIPKPGGTTGIRNATAGVQGTPPPSDPPESLPVMAAAMDITVVGRPPEIGATDEGAGAAPCLRMARVEDVVPTPDNPRKRIDTKAPDFLELVESVKALGILQPLVARPHPQQPGKLDLRAGHRRHEAAKVAGLTEVPVMVREMSDRVAMEVTVLENLQRVDLTPMEEARGVKLLKESGHDLEEIAAQMGKSRAWIMRRANLLNLDEQWQEWGEEKGISAAHLELIARYDERTQLRLFGELAEGYGWNELFLSPGSLGDLKARLAEDMRELLLAPWSLDDATLDAKAGACAQCPKRSNCQPDLFDEQETAGGDRCLDENCWQRKMDVFKERREAALRVEHPGLIKVAGKGGSTYLTGGKRVAGALDNWDYDKSKAKAKDAVPALVISGEGEGTLIWVKPKSHSSGHAKQKLQTAAGRQAAASQDPKACEELLEEKRAQLDQRRTAWVIERLLAVLDEMERPAPTFDNEAGYLALVASFGTAPLAGGFAGEEEVPYCWDTQPNGGVMARRAAWEMVKPRIRQEMFFERSGSIRERHREGCQWIANLIGADINALKEQSEKEIPEPKAWEQLRKLAEAPPPAKEKPEQKPAKKAAAKKKGKAAA